MYALQIRKRLPLSLLSKKQSDFIRSNLRHMASDWHEYMVETENVPLGTNADVREPLEADTHFWATIKIDFSVVEFAEQGTSRTEIDFVTPIGSDFELMGLSWDGLTLYGSQAELYFELIDECEKNLHWLVYDAGLKRQAEEIQQEAEGLI